MQGTKDSRNPLNGRTRSPLRGASFAMAGAEGDVGAYDDPMSKVLGLDAKTSGFAAWFGFTSGSTLLMAALMALATVVAWVHTVNAGSAEAKADEIEVMKEDVPPPPPPEPEAKPEPAAPPPRAALHEPPPAPAQAAKVLAREPDPNEPVDLTGYTIVQGNGDQYAGGFTASNGKNANAVNTAPSPSGIVGGAGPVAAVVRGPDRSRGASVSGGSEWHCPFPPEADSAQLDESYVILQADVRADGTASAVRIVSDPGSGFGREAKRCALGNTYATALDHDGNPIAGSTKPFRVHFSR